ncbi:outer membrane protein [Bosea sp. MMO-172]|uniref:outer membrane protein n=1 Tax=Bosea sp. MMO-172 TaxID=3127885 RepID=UPI00301A32FC
MRAFAAFAAGAALFVIGPAATAADLASRAPAAAPPIFTTSGLYVAGSAGFGWNPSFGQTPDSVQGPSTGTLVPPNSFHLSTDAGFSGVASVGWAFGNGLRIEAEYGHRTNKVDSFVTTYGFPVTHDIRSGSITSDSAMVNLLYDIGATMGWPVHLTVGGGIGYARLNYNNVAVRARDGTTGYQTVRLDDDSSGFAWQGIVGLSYPIPSIPGLSLTADYRYFGTTSRGVRGSIVQGAITAAGVVGATVATGTSRARSDYSNHSVMVGLRYSFGQGRQL